MRYSHEKCYITFGDSVKQAILISSVRLKGDACMQLGSTLQFILGNSVYNTITCNIVYIYIHISVYMLFKNIVFY